MGNTSVALTAYIAGAAPCGKFERRSKKVSKLQFLFEISVLVSSS